MFNFNITPETIINQGMHLSKNFILAHTSNGAYHYVLGKIVPTFTAFLKPGSSSTPLWKIASNLQMGAQGILEELMSGFGSDLIIKSAFRNSISNVNDVITNIDEITNSVTKLNAVKDIMKLTNTATNLANNGQSFDIQIRGYENNMYKVAKDIQLLAKRASDIQLLYGNSSSMRINFNEKSIKTNILKNEIPSLKTIDVMTTVLENGLTSINGV